MVTQACCPVKGEAEPMLSVPDHALADHRFKEKGRWEYPRASDLAGRAPLCRGARERGPGRAERGICECRPELKRTLLVCGILLSLARCAWGHQGGGRKQKGHGCGPRTCYGRNSVSMRGMRPPSRLPAEIALKLLHKRILSTHPSQHECLLCVPRTYSFYLLSIAHPSSPPTAGMGSWERLPGRVGPGSTVSPCPVGPEFLHLTMWALASQTLLVSR